LDEEDELIPTWTKMLEVRETGMQTSVATPLLELAALYLQARRGR
jgi:hypothetical protein